VLLEILFAVGTCRAPEAPREEVMRILDGGKLSEEQAAELESRIKETPGDLEARSQLLGYYQMRAFKSPTARKARQAHVMWIIEHQPDSSLARSGFVDLNPHLDGEVYYKARDMWLATAKQRADDPAILGSAARFLLLNDRDSAKRFFLAGARLEPECPDWPRHLAGLVSLHASDKKAAAEALGYYERAMALMDSEDAKAWLSQAVKTAFAAEEFEKAETMAKELATTPRDRRDGDAIHHGNLILGRLALRRGELDKAKQHLLAAGRTPGSAVLSSFGPNMTLALELIEKGERQVVLEYFELCARFWKNDDGRLKAWAATVKGGGTPDFGANLNY